MDYRQLLFRVGSVVSDLCDPRDSSQAMLLSPLLSPRVWLPSIASAKSHHITYYHFLFVVTTWKVYSLDNFQVYKRVSLTSHQPVHQSSQNLFVHLTTGSPCSSPTIPHFPLPHHPTLSFCKLRCSLFHM